LEPLLSIFFLIFLLNQKGSRPKGHKITAFPSCQDQPMCDYTTTPTLLKSCRFSKIILPPCMPAWSIRLISVRVNMNLKSDVDWVLEKGCQSWKTKAMRGVLCRLVLSATVYEIWKARNAIRHGGQIKTEEQILKSIIWEIRYRVSRKRNFKKNLENISLCLNWNIDVNVLV
jgi:hypothetical protein